MTRLLQQSLPIRVAAIVAACTAMVLGVSGTGQVVASTAGESNVGPVNLTYQGVSIRWDTTTSASGAVNFGTTCGTSDGGLSSQGGADKGNGNFHLVGLTNLSPATVYFYDVVTGGQVDDNSGSCFQFKTLPQPTSPPPQPAVAYGQIVTGTGCNVSLTSGLVLATDTNGSTTSIPNAVLVGSQAPNKGQYAVDFSPAALPDSSGFMQANPGDTITVTVDNGPHQVSEQATWTGASIDQSMPQLCLSYPVPVTAGSPNVTYGQADVTVSYQTPASTLCQAGPPNPYCKTRVVNPIVTCSYGGGAPVPAIQATGLTTAPAGAPRGTYPTDCWGAYDPNYTFSYSHGTLTVNPASLTIRPSRLTVARGGRLPRLTWKANFVNDDTASSLSRQPTCRARVRTDRRGRIISPAGSYRIRCVGARDSNYRIHYVYGTLRVTRPHRS